MFQGCFKDVAKLSPSFNSKLQLRLRLALIPVSPPHPPTPPTEKLAQTHSIKKLLLQNVSNSYQRTQTGFENRKWKYTNRKWNYFSYFLSSNQKNFFYKMFLIFDSESKIGFESRKWNYSNRKWNYFFYFLSSNKNIFYKMFINFTMEF